MPIYKIKSPDGRIVSLKGDTPPTEQDLNNIFSNLPGKQPEIAQQQQVQLPQPIQPQGISGALQQLVEVGQQGLPTEAVPAIAKDPKGASIKTLQALQAAGQFGTAAMPYLSGVTTTPITEFWIQKLKGKETKEALKQAAIAGGIDLAIPAALKYGVAPVVKTFGKLASKATKATLKKAIPMFTGISEESTEIALNNPSIFKGKMNLEKTFGEIGKQAQDASDYLKKTIGKAVGVEKKIIKSMPGKYNFTDLAESVDNKIINTWSKSGLVEKLTPSETRKIGAYADKLREINKRTGSPDDLLELRELLDKNINWKKTEKSSLFNNILEEIRGEINNKLVTLSPKFAKVNAKYENFKNLDKLIQKRISNEATAGTNLQSMFKKALKTEDRVAFLDQFKELDDLVPKKHKFIEKANDVLVRQQFESWEPTGQTARRIRSLGGLGAFGGAAARSPEILVGSAAAIGATAPKTYKKVIQGIAGAEQGTRLLHKAAQDPLTQGLLKQSSKRLRDLMKLKDREYQR